MILTDGRKRKGGHEFETDHKPIEYGVSISFRVPSGVVPKNTESLNMKIFLAPPQSINNFDAQRQGIAIQFFPVLRSSFMAALLDKKFKTSTVILPLSR